jgi:DNA polymerase-1
VDVVYIEKAIRKTKRKIEYLQKGMEDSRVVRIWKRRFGRKFKLGSNEQLGVVLFEELGLPCPAKTETGRYKTDEAALGAVDLPFVKDYLAVKKQQRALTTYLIGFQKEVVNGYIHPNFPLNMVATFRSSSDNPNFQNIPVRNKKIMKLVRSMFIPRPGCRIVEVDFAGIEVRGAACYHKDPNMISYIKDKTKDMHRDMAMECYLLPQKEVSKEIRYCGKNMFVFPQFYGDWYKDCARSLWEAMGKMSLVTTSGIPLRQHLEEKGIKKLGDCNPKDDPVPGTFEYHLQRVERNFWEKRFPVYAKWKKTWYEAYKKRGWMLTLSEFICQGYMKKNEVINYPVQGVAFHWLLWTLIELMKEIEKRKMKTLIGGQIHDSIVGDVPEEEMDDYQELVHDITSRRLREAWDWICVPVEVEVEAAPVDRPWCEKVKLEAVHA